MSEPAAMSSDGAGARAPADAGAVAGPAAEVPVLACAGLCKRYDDGGLGVQVLNGVSLAVRPGERVASNIR